MRYVNLKIHSETSSSWIRALWIRPKDLRIPDEANGFLNEITEVD